MVESGICYNMDGWMDVQCLLVQDKNAWPTEWQDKSVGEWVFLDRADSPRELYISKEYEYHRNKFFRERKKTI